MESSKQTMRRQMRERRRRLREEQIVAAGRTVARELQRLSCYRSCDAIYSYVATQNEVPTRDLWDVAWAGGVPLFLPRLVDGELRFAPYEAGDPLHCGAFGILEPQTPVENAVNARRPLVLLPLLAWNARGTRLGRGGGHYDRAASDWPDGTVRIGLGYTFQRCPHLPREPWDAPVDLVITERGVVRCEGEGNLSHSGREETTRNGISLDNSRTRRGGSARLANRFTAQSAERRTAEGHRGDS
jgi:5-formyltetrahydrofolate cyclo-ligase